MITMMFGELAVGNYGTAAILQGNANAEAAAELTAGNAVDVADVQKRADTALERNLISLAHTRRL
jgi:hypothetical protein